MSWLFPRKLKWAGDVVSDEKTGRVLAKIACIRQTSTVEGIWVIWPWDGHWRQDCQNASIDRESAVAAAERMFR